MTADLHSKKEIQLDINACAAKPDICSAVPSLPESVLMSKVRANPASFVYETPEILVSASQEDRYQAAMECARHAPEHIVSKIQDFGILEEEQRYKIARICAGKEGLYTALYIERFDLTSEERRAKVAALCMQEDLDGTLHKFENFQLHDQNLIGQLAIESAGRNGALTAKFLSSFNITDQNSKLNVIHECAYQNLAGTRTELKAQGAEGLLDMLSDQEIFTESLKRGNLSNILALYNTSVADSAVVRPALQRQMFFKNLEEKAAEPSFDPALKNIASMLGWCEKQGVFPRDSLAKAFLHFNPDEYRFFKDLILKFGISACTNVLEVLVAVQPELKKISSSDKELIVAFLQSSFSGFSKHSFACYKSAYNISASRADALISHWKSLSDDILNCRAISQEVLNDPIFPELVYSVYRPANFTVEEVRERLVKDLEDVELPPDFISLPEEGVEIRVRRRADSKTKSGQSIEQAALIRESELIIQTGSISSSADKFLAAISAATNHDFTAEHKLNLLGYLLNCSSGDNLRVIRDELEDLQNIENSADWCYAALPLLLEFYTVQLQDAARLALSEMDLSQSQIEKLIIESGLTNESSDTLEIDQELALRIKEAFTSEVSFIISENDKITSEAGKRTSGYLKAYLSMDAHTYFSRASARICSGDDLMSWLDPDYLQIALADPSNNRMAGNIQLHLFDMPSGERALLARMNPNTEIVRKYDPEDLAKSMIELAWKVADLNKLQLYLPEQGQWHALTNRLDLCPALESYQGDTFEITIQVTSDTTVSNIFAARRNKKAKY